MEVQSFQEKKREMEPDFVGDGFLAIGVGIFFLGGSDNFLEEREG